MAETGIELIANERRRQIESEGWTPEHDDEHSDNEIAQAARAYISRAISMGRYPGISTRSGAAACPYGWPWDEKWWKPSPEPIRNLVKAGALIAAEIDRLQRVVRSEAINLASREAAKRDQLENSKRILKEAQSNG
jgi:hypothetical protein